MTRKVICIVLVITHLHLVTGCIVTRSSERSKESLDTTEKIVDVILKDGHRVKFPDGATYDRTGWTIRGRDSEGNDIAMTLSSVLEIRTSRVEGMSPESVEFGSVVELIMREDNRVVTFSKPPKFNSTSGIINGETFGGGIATVPIADVKEVRTLTPKKLATTLPSYDTTLTITEIVAKKGRRLISFDQQGGRMTRPLIMVVRGFDEEGKPRQIKIDDILYVNVSKVNVGGSILASMGVLLLAALTVFAIALATKQSCPFVYSYDGERFVFDAEPLGGAISRGLSKTDLSRLEHLKSVDNSYELLFRNEVEETQYLDEAKLVVVDHEASLKVVPDEMGRFHLVRHPVSPIRATDEHGKDLSIFINERDGVYWTTALPMTRSANDDPSRHTLSFDFEKPRDVTSARLVVRAGTALWGSNMIRQMLTLRGDKVDDWYAAIDAGKPELEELMGFVTREELYVLMVNADVDGTYSPVGHIPGGGPLIYEDRVIPLDLSGAPGDTLRLQLRPPYGFWSLDYIAIEYGEDTIVDGKQVSIASAVNHNGSDITSSMTDTDGMYHTMPKVGDWFKVSFDAPDASAGMERSIFLQTTGYYTLHLQKDTPEQTALIQHLLKTPGAIVQYAMDYLQEWKESMAASH